MRLRTIAALACCLVAAACAERPTQPREALPVDGGLAAVTSCPAPSAIEDLIKQVFPSGGDRSSALSKYSQVLKLLSPKNAGTDSANAKAHAINLVQFINDKYEAGRLIGGQSLQTQAKLYALLNGILCGVGLPPAFGPGSLGPDGAVAFIFPTSPDTDVVTETGWGGVHVPAASVTTPSILTVQRLPDFPGPLLTPLDQYPLYYEYHLSPAGPFTQDVTVGICLASNATPPDLNRLRVGHNIAPYVYPSIEILPLATAGFIDCTSAPIAAATTRWGFDLARLERGFTRLFLPAPLQAKNRFGTGGVGGTTREFSPFGIVDTLGSMAYNGPNEVRGALGGTADNVLSVVLRTPTGQPMRGVTVTFTTGANSGSIAGATAVTDANGVATSGAWTLRTTAGCGTATAHATMTPGSGLTGDPILFYGCAR